MNNWYSPYKIRTNHGCILHKIVIKYMTVNKFSISTSVVINYERRVSMQLSNFMKVKMIKEGVYVVFNTLLMEVIYISKYELERLMKLDLTAEEVTAYKKAGILVESSSKDEQALECVKKEFASMEKEVAVLYLILSSGCNLGCKYCFIENSMYNNKCELNMSEEVLETAVKKYCDYVKKHGISEPLILFYGGEPLVNWQAIEKTVQIVSERGVKMAYSIVTNATLLDEERVKFLVQHDVEIGISIDGPKELNDKNRVYRNSDSSVYDTVTEKIKLLQKYGARFGLSITVSQDFLDHKEEALKWIKEYGVKDIFYNLYHFTCKAEWEEYYKEACKFLITSYKELAPYGIVDGRLQRKIDSFLKGTFKFADCASIGANQLTIKPNGDMCVCQGYLKSDQYVIGNIKTYDLDEIHKSEEFEFWAGRSPIKNEKCLECEAFFICGGGCAMQAEALFGSRMEMDIPFCNHTKTALDWLLLESYESGFGE